MSRTLEIFNCGELERSHLFPKNRYAILEKASLFENGIGLMRLKGLSFAIGDGDQRFPPLDHGAVASGYFTLFLQLQAVEIGGNESRNTPQINMII